MELFDQITIISRSCNRNQTTIIIGIGHITEFPAIYPVLQPVEYGIVDTPNFVAVGTNGTLKAVDHRQADDANLQLMFCNTYHLLLQPGPELVEAAGGLH
eukprot:gene26862-33022_t